MNSPETEAAFRERSVRDDVHLWLARADKPGAALGHLYASTVPRPVLDRREHWVRRIWVVQTIPGQSQAGYLAPGFRLAHEWRLAGGSTAVWLYTKGPAGV